MKILTVFILVLSTSFLYAAVDESGRITRIIVEGNQWVSVWLDGVDITSDCSGGGRWTVNHSDVLFKEKLSMLISAATAQKRVRLHGLECGGWHGNKIYFIEVRY